MPVETDFSIRANLLKPSQSVAMRIQAADDVVESVAIHVVGIHLRAAAICFRKFKRMKFPDGIAGQRGRLLPPAILFENVRASVAIHIAHAEAMLKFSPRAFWGNAVIDLKS